VTDGNKYRAVISTNVQVKIKYEVLHSSCMSEYLQLVGALVK
jgi:hypothetical protein